jgi:CHAT domain-containing protein
VLEAQLLLWQGRNAASLALVGDGLPADLASTELEIRWAMVGATAYARVGQMERSDELLRRAQTLCEEQHSKLIGEVFRTRGVIDVERNDLTHANEMFRQSLQIARQQDDKFLLASALLNLGVIALQQEHFDETLDWSREAAQVARVIDARVIEEKSQGNVAYASYALGNFEDALNRFREAQLEAERVGSPNDEVEWLNDAGLSLYRLGEYKEAEDCYNKALKIAESIQYQGEIIETHVALASLYVQHGMPEAAIRHTDAAFALAHSAGKIFDEMDTQFLRGIIAIRQNKMNEAREILTNLVRNPAIRPSLRWQVEGALANLNAEAKNSAMANNWYQQSITTFETQRATIKKEESKLPFSTHADQLYDDYVRFLVDQKRTDEGLHWLELGRARTLEEGLGVASPDFKAAIKSPLDAPAIARRLHGTILVYDLAPDESYLWAVNSSGTHFFKLPPQEEIAAHVKSYQRAILSSRDPVADAYVDGMALYKILVEPAASLISKGSTVYIIPDGSLTTLNFETLLAPGGGIHYWIEDATITNASSLKLLAAFHPEKREKNQKQLLLIGNPISPDEKFPDLPNASAEVKNVSKHFLAGQESVFVQNEALPSSYFNSNPGEFSLIHFVAHGTSSSASPLDSAIVLTRNPANPDSFKLYARDVIAHPLHADLVAISACYGSGSRVYGGEGIVGLSWAFLRAGAHYVIGSLWEVSDSAAPQIMDHMYGEIAAGRSPDAALRDAKLNMINSQNIFRKPLYWATFQLYGGA